MKEQLDLKKKKKNLGRNELVANLLKCNIVVSKFELRSRYHVLS